MTDNKKKIILIVSVLILIVFIYTIFLKSKNKKDGKTKSGNVSSKGISVSVPLIQYNKGNSFPLSEGSNGENVKRLQSALNKNEIIPLSIDGLFGSKTKQASLNQLGKIVISEKDIEELEKREKGESIPFEVSENDKLELLAWDVNNDISNKTYPFGRTNSHPYTDLMLLDDENLSKLADIFKKNHSKTLLKAIDDAFFSAFSKIDSQIMNRLRDLGKTK